MLERLLPAARGMPALKRVLPVTAVLCALGLAASVAAIAALFTILAACLQARPLTCSGLLIVPPDRYTAGLRLDGMRLGL